MSIGLVTKSIHTLLILTLELLDEVVETVVIEVLVSTICDSGDHGTEWRRTVWGCAWKAGMGCGLRKSGASYPSQPGVSTYPGKMYMVCTYLECIKLMATLHPYDNATIAWRLALSVHPAVHLANVVHCGKLST